MATRPEASRATKFTYLPSCSANELVHRRLGVFCIVFASVYWGKWYILRRHARRGKAWLTDRRPRARLSLLTYLAALLMSWFIGVLVYFVQFLHRLIGGKWSILRRHANGLKAWILDRRPRARLSLLTYLAALLMSWCIGVLVYFVQFLHRFIGENGTF